MSHVATPEGTESPKVLHTDALPQEMERHIDFMPAEQSAHATSSCLVRTS